MTAPQSVGRDQDSDIGRSSHHGSRLIFPWGEADPDRLTTRHLSYLRYLFQRARPIQFLQLFGLAPYRTAASYGTRAYQRMGVWFHYRDPDNDQMSETALRRPLTRKERRNRF